MMKWLENFSVKFLKNKGYVVYIDQRKRRRTAYQIKAQAMKAEKEKEA